MRRVSRRVVVVARADDGGEKARRFARREVRLVSRRSVSIPPGKRASDTNGRPFERKDAFDAFDVFFPDVDAFVWRFRRFGEKSQRVVASAFPRVGVQTPLAPGEVPRGEPLGDVRRAAAVAARAGGQQRELVRRDAETAGGAHERGGAGERLFLGISLRGGRLFLFLLALNLPGNRAARDEPGDERERRLLLHDATVLGARIERVGRGAFLRRVRRATRSAIRARGALGGGARRRRVKRGARRVVHVAERRARRVHGGDARGGAARARELRRDRDSIPGIQSIEKSSVVCFVFGDCFGDCSGTRRFAVGAGVARVKRERRRGRYRAVCSAGRGVVPAPPHAPVARGPERPPGDGPGDGREHREALRSRRKRVLFVFIQRHARAGAERADPAAQRPVQRLLGPLRPLERQDTAILSAEPQKHERAELFLCVFFRERRHRRVVAARARGGKRVPPRRRRLEAQPRRRRRRAVRPPRDRRVRLAYVVERDRAVARERERVFQRHRRRSERRRKRKRRRRPRRDGRPGERAPREVAVNGLCQNRSKTRFDSQVDAPHVVRSREERDARVRAVRAPAPIWKRIGAGEGGGGRRRDARGVAERAFGFGFFFHLSNAARRVAGGGVHHAQAAVFGRDEQFREAVRRELDVRRRGRGRVPGARPQKLGVRRRVDRRRIIRTGRRELLS